MSDRVSLQSDIGALGLMGLGAFSTVLTALSADNISPMAILQMEQLGSVFNVNGSFAAKVPESLTRFSSHPLGRLALAVGWRRGDSASLLAQSAGGQAISLLSVCLTNLYRTEAVGQILAALCGKLLPKTFPIASVAHLADVAALLASKLNRLGFGNVLAEQAIRVLSAYENLGIGPPKDLLETPSAESMVEVFESLNRLTEEGLVIRIEGSYGVVHILGIILFMFPLDAVVTVASFIIHEGPNRRVIVHIGASGPTQIQVEKELGQPPFLTLPVRSPEAHEKIKGDYCFEWQGWLARKLELEFARFGALCTQRVLVSCCNLLVVLAPLYRSYFPFNGNDINMPRRGIEGLLGPYSRSRMEQACQAVFLAIPEEAETDMETSWAKFTSTLEEAAERVTCVCTKCSFISGWPSGRITNTQLSCPRHQLWVTVGRALTAGLYCLPVNVRGPVAVPGRLPKNIAGEIISRTMRTEGLYICTANFLEGVLETFSARTGGSLGRSSGACTIFPAVIETLEVHQDGVFNFELLDGMFILTNRYHRALSSSGGPRAKAKSSLLPTQAPIIPSSRGEHSDISVTLREGYSELLVQLTARMAGSFVPIDMTSMVIAYMGLERSNECQHRLDYPLNERYRRKITVTGVSMPRAAGKKLALAMTRANPGAQLLCCEEGARCIFLQGCCLDCGVEQAGEAFNVLIVS
jgi:hypothetical protein